MRYWDRRCSRNPSPPAPEAARTRLPRTGAASSRGDAEHRVHRQDAAGEGREQGRHGATLAGRATTVRPPVGPRFSARGARGGGTGEWAITDRARHKPLHPGGRRERSSVDDAAALGGIPRRDLRLARSDFAGRLGRPERPCYLTGAHLRTAPAATLGLLRQASGGRPDEPGDERRGHPEPAALAGTDAASRLVLQPDRGRRRDARPRLALGLGMLHYYPGDAPHER